MELKFYMPTTSDWNSFPLVFYETEKDVYFLESKTKNPNTVDYFKTKNNVNTSFIFQAQKDLGESIVETGIKNTYPLDQIVDLSKFGFYATINVSRIFVLKKVDFFKYFGNKNEFETKTIKWHDVLFSWISQKIAFNFKKRRTWCLYTIKLPKKISVNEIPSYFNYRFLINQPSLAFLQHLYDYDVTSSFLIELKFYYKKNHIFSIMDSYIKNLKKNFELDFLN